MAPPPTDALALIANLQAHVLDLDARVRQLEAAQARAGAAPVTQPAVAEHPAPRAVPKPPRSPARASLPRAAPAPTPIPAAPPAPPRAAGPRHPKPPRGRPPLPQPAAAAPPVATVASRAPAKRPAAQKTPPVSEAPPSGERERILAALKATGGSRVAAAQRMGMPRRTFYRRLKTYGIPPA